MQFFEEGFLKVSLISPQVVGSKEQVRRVQPPLGIACLAGVLENNGYKDIQIIDAAAEGYNNIVELEEIEDFIRFGLEHEEVVAKVLKFNPNVIGISALFSSQVGMAFELARKLKEAMPNVPIVMGGIHASKKAVEILKNEISVDYIISGEGDFLFTEMVQLLEKGADVKKLPSLYYRDENGQVLNNPSPPLLKMDDLPMPAWHLMDIENYYEIGMPHNPFKKYRNFMCIMTSRGCPEKCYFCSSAEYFGYGFRALSPEKTIEMFQYVHDRFGVKEFQIEDDTFTLNWTRVVKICEGIAHLGLRITLPNAIRADYPKSHEHRLAMFKAMKKAGVDQVSMSVEHGDQDFLNKTIGKRLNLDEVLISIELAHQAGLLVHNNFMMGFPFETKELRDKTASFARSLTSDSFSVSLATPLPGTKMWTIVEENNLFMKDFNVNKVVFDQVSIKPLDISAEDLKSHVTALNRELNSKARLRSTAADDKYKLLNRKEVSSDRKYLANG